MLFVLILINIINFTYASSGQIVLAPITDQNTNYPPCNLYNLANIFASSDNIENLIAVLNHFGLENALITGWNGEPFECILSTNGTLTPYEAGQNTSAYEFCATGDHGSLVVPNFNLEPQMIVNNGPIKKAENLGTLNSNGYDFFKPNISIIINNLKRRCAPYSTKEIDTTRMIYETEKKD